MKTSQLKKPFKPNIEKARRALERNEIHLHKYGSPLDGLTKEEIIARVRKTREQLWEEKLSTPQSKIHENTTIKKTFKPDYEKAFHYFQKARERLKRQGSPLDSLTKEEIIARVRKTREQLWEEKLAARP